MNDKDKSNLGLFAVLFGVIFSTLFGIFKLAKENAEGGAELKQARDAIDELFIEGEDEGTIANALLLRAHEELGDQLTEDQMNKLKKLVHEERLKLESTGKLPKKKGV